MGTCCGRVENINQIGSINDLKDIVQLDINFNKKNSNIIYNDKVNYINKIKEYL
jgi:hypothetical protein